MRVSKLLLIAILGVVATPTAAVGPGSDPAVASEPEAQGFQDTTVWIGLDFPTALALASTGRLFVAELGGTMERRSDGGTRLTLVIPRRPNVTPAIMAS